MTYEDFVVGLSPDPSDKGLRFHAKRGWLLQAAAEAEGKPYLLIVDEINRGDLGKVLGEAIYLFEPGEVGGTPIPQLLDKALRDNVLRVPGFPAITRQRSHSLSGPLANACDFQTGPSHVDHDTRGTGSSHLDRPNIDSAFR